MSRLDLIAGPNGAGKTTFYQQVIAPLRPGLPFVNSDEIARLRFPGNELEHAYDAASIAAATRTALIAARLDFCTETVFSHPSKLDLVAEADAAGYDVELHVLLVPLELAVARVAARVAAGGHDVPGPKIAERYERLWPLVARAIGSTFRTVVYDNSSRSGPFEVAVFRFGVADYEAVWPRWTPSPLRGLV